MINVDSYHTQKGVYTANQIPTKTERNAWHHGDVMKTKNETKLMVKSYKNPYQSPLRIPSHRLLILSDRLRKLTTTHPRIQNDSDYN